MKLNDSQKRRTPDQIEADIARLDQRFKDINAEINTLRNERDGLHEKRFNLKQELLKALERELEVPKESK